MTVFTHASFERYCAKRGAGFRAEALALALPPADLVRIPSEPLESLRRRFPLLPLAPRPSPRAGLGDLVAAVATPIARALRLPCIDPATNQLRPESVCAQRRETLNRLTRS